MKARRLIPKEAKEAADRIAARLKGNPEAIARLHAHLERQASPTASDVVRQAIASCGLSREELCRRTGVEPATLSRFMSGGASVTLTTFEKLADELALKVTSRRRRTP